MEKEIFNLIKELFQLNTLHQEYKSNDCSYVIDSQKEGDTLIIKVTLKEDKDKKEFEKWLQTVDNDIFEEVLDELKGQNGLTDINELYESENYKQVINQVKSKTKEIVAKRIKQLQKLLD